MTTLREAAQQALEALGSSLYPQPRQMAAIAALRAALENEFNPDWDQVGALQEALREHMAEIHRLRAALAEPDEFIEDETIYCPTCGEEDGGTTCGMPDCGLRCGAGPVQEPYCYVYEYDSPHGLHREFYPREYNGMKPTRTVQVYAAPPQRKPLSAVDLRALYDQHAACQEEGPETSGWWDFARALERAHGIT
jgi:hypothetical protein